PTIFAEAPILPRNCAAASCARAASREPITISTPALAQRYASPEPSGPVPPTIAILPSIRVAPMPAFGDRHSTVSASIPLRVQPAQYGIVANSTMTSAPVTALDFRNACGYFATGVTVITAERSLGAIFRWTPSGVPVLENTLVQMACNVVNTYVAGDHTIFLGEVASLEVFSGRPLLFVCGQYHDFTPTR